VKAEARIAGALRPPGSVAPLRRSRCRYRAAGRDTSDCCEARIAFTLLNLALLVFGLEELRPAKVAPTALGWLFVGHWPRSPDGPPFCPSPRPGKHGHRGGLRLLPCHDTVRPGSPQRQERIRWPQRTSRTSIFAKTSATVPLGLWLRGHPQGQSSPPGATSGAIRRGCMSCRSRSPSPTRTSAASDATDRQKFLNARAPEGRYASLMTGRCLAWPATPRSPGAKEGSQPMIQRRVPIRMLRVAIVLGCPFNILACS